MLSDRRSVSGLAAEPHGGLGDPWHRGTGRLGGTPVGGKEEGGGDRKEREE